MEYSLGKNWSFCVVGPTTILMDVENNAYLALPPLLVSSFERLQKAGRADVPDPRPLALLIESGIVEVGSSGRSISPCTLSYPPTREFGGDRLTSRNVSDVIHATINLMQMRRALTRRKFSSILHDLRTPLDRSLNQPVTCEIRAREIASAFLWLNAFMTRHDQCLLRSLAMMNCLRASSIGGTLVFGIATRPFSAHCWIQYRDVVLNDTLEAVRNYTPILEL